jgi:hypothetical protein
MPAEEAGKDAGPRTLRRAGARCRDIAVVSAVPSRPAISLPGVLLVNREFYPRRIRWRTARVRAEIPAMSTERRGIFAVLASIWRSIVKAFTPTHERRGTDLGGADTTLFGTMQDPDGSRRTPAAKDEFWNPTGESTDFHDPDHDGKRDRR